jgi:CBS domain-containing protein
MSYQVRQVLEGKGTPVCVNKNDTVALALALMIEHDYSQLPVIKKQDGFEVPEGMITYEGILRGIRNFKLSIDDLKVRDVMVEAKAFTIADDLFDILDRLKNTNAVLIISDEIPELVGIVTSYDTTDYFRNRTEDLMRVEDIEVTIKDLIREAYINTDSELDNDKLTQAISKVSHRSQGERQKFGDLSMAEYINLLTLPESWDFFQKIFKLSRESVRELLNGIREIRNSLAHFRGDITAEQRDKLKFGTEWLSRCQEEYQAQKQRDENAQLMELFKKQDLPQEVRSIREEPNQYNLNISASVDPTDFAITESATSGGRYAALADWLQSQPGRVDQVQLTFNQIEEIIETDLP